jgi:hypothetical protein
MGPFLEIAKQHDIDDLLAKWITREVPRVSMLSSYMSLVTVAGLAYIANFTLQRKEEAASLRTTCLLWELDERLGRVPLICGETTKTMKDSDARWVASPSVELAVQVLTTIARLRMLCDRVNDRIQPSAADQKDPYLFSTATEPWGYSLGHARRYNIRTEISDLKDIVNRYPLLFDTDALRITSDDLKIASRLTPNLPRKEFEVGKVWPLAWHQSRRTGAVNMFASGVISDSSMQQQMKHASRLMPLYYEEVEKAVIKGMYEAMAQRLKAAVNDRFVSPHSPERKDVIVVNALKESEVKTLVQWAKEGKVSFRETRLGGCMKPGPCDYGGFESVARCGGGDKSKPCSDALFDLDKEPQVRAELANVTEQIAQFGSDNPRKASLAAERGAMVNFLNVVSSKR